MDAGNLQAIMDEALKSASDEANRRLAEQDKKLPPINTAVEASSQTNYRQPAQLEQRVTEMRFDPPPPVAPKPEGVIGDTLLFSTGTSDGTSDGIPDGETDGDMLYWDATDEEWILLPAPSAPDTGKRWVMHHDGTAPEWVEYDEVTVNICIDGLPTEYTILGIPTP
jgi:hypothetical protein